eukprot:135451_1
MSVLGKRTHQSLDDSDEDSQSTLPPSKKQRLSNPANVTLNVGGKKYETTIQTLTGYNSMLKPRFSSQYAMNRSDDGSYFVDGDGELFKYILKYLRTGMLLLPSKWNRDQIWEFYIEVKYLMIESLFNKVLLKLFNSEIVKNDPLKLIIINKISNILKCDENKSTNIMESLNEWKLIGSLEKHRLGVRSHTLSLVVLDQKIYGMFVTNYEEEGKGKFYYDFSKSFSFCCGTNSYHLLSTKSSNDIHIQFGKVRKLTKKEQKTDPDADDEEVSYNWTMSLHPMSIRVDTKTIKNEFMRMMTQKTSVVKVRYMGCKNDQFTLFAASELWSIPV